MTELCVSILNFRRALLTIECLRSVQGEVAGHPERCAIVVDNDSRDGSAEAIERAITENGWTSWARVVRAERNGGFASGNNIAFAEVRARFYLLLNSDARLRPGAVDILLQAAAAHPDVGLIGPRLEDQSGAPQISCFRYRTPMGEFLRAAATGLLDRVFRGWVVAGCTESVEAEPEWMSFACILLRGEMIERVGPMDDAYFMYFEDVDYCRRARAAGWRLLHEPQAAAVHLRGGTSSVKAAMRARRRVPRYYYESRSRYFARWYGGVWGVVLANILWCLGRVIACARWVAGHRAAGACERELADNWTNWWRPFAAPTLPEGADV